MKKEAIHFYIIVGTILIIMGIFSLIYGFIIPTRYLPMNEFPSLLFKGVGIVFIAVGLILIIFLRKREIFQNVEIPNGGIDDKSGP